MTRTPIFCTPSASRGFSLPPNLVVFELLCLLHRLAPFPFIRALRPLPALDTTSFMLSQLRLTKDTLRGTHQKQDSWADMQVRGARDREC